MKRATVHCTFGPYTVDASRRRLLRDGAPVPLNGKAFELLLLLIASEGAALTREDLYERLWPEGTVEDGNLSQNVYLLRRALDPHGDGRQYIETLPRFGYRFTVAVRNVADEIVPAPPRRIWHAAAAAVLAASLALAGSAAKSAPPPLTSAARETLALGTYHLTLRTKSELSYARAYFRQTIASAPKNAAGYAGAASAEALTAEYMRDGSEDQRGEIELAERYRNKALQVDPRDSNALAVSGFLAYRFQGNDAAAEGYLSQALSADPGNAAAHHWHGVLLLSEGRIGEAVADLEAAHRLQPTSEVFSRWLARAYEYANRPSDAIRMAMQTLRIEPGDDGATIVLACAQEQHGDLRAALHTLRSLAARAPYERRFVIADEARLDVLLHPGVPRTHELAEIDRLAARGRVDAFEAALYYLTIGSDERASAVLRRAPLSHVFSGLDEYDPRLEALHGAFLFAGSTA